MCGGDFASPSQASEDSMIDLSNAALRERAAEIMRFVRGAQGMTHEGREWFIERIMPILAGLRDAARAEQICLVNLCSYKHEKDSRFETCPTCLAVEKARAEQREAILKALCPQCSDAHVLENGRVWGFCGAWKAINATPLDEALWVDAIRSQQ